MSDLVAAGAPELPEGHFYRVRPFTRSGITVEVRRRRRIVGSELMAYSITFPGNYESGTEAVVKCCRAAAEGFTTRLADRASELAARAYIGDHDPRR
ncbi:hypothetical protein [Streptomyces sp. NPDC048603]|uniref:hypothetical protein n=1 Tax=Streptomyces sp. NPDC048603 TaxID=3365577 RepID=UPI0037230DBE